MIGKSLKSARTWPLSKHGKSAMNSSPSSTCFARAAGQPVRSGGAARLRSRIDLRKELTNFCQRTPGRGGRHRYPAHARFPAGDPARDPARPVLRKKKSPAPTCWWRSSARRIPCGGISCSAGNTRLDVELHLHGITKAAAAPAPPRPASEPGEQEQEAAGRRRALRARHAEPQPAGAVGKIDPLIGRVRKRSSASSRPLCRRRKNNPLLVGEAGVGKTAIAEAWRAVSSRPRARDLGRDHLAAPRHGRPARRHQIPRRLRAAPQASQAARREPERIRSSTRSTP